MDSTHELPLYGDSSILILIGQFRRDLPAKSLEGTEFVKAAIVSSDLTTEWKMYHQLLIKQTKDDISMQLKELLTNDMLIALFPYLHKLATICLSIPISTASAERRFSHMKLIKNRLRNCVVGSGRMQSGLVEARRVGRSRTVERPPVDGHSLAPLLFAGGGGLSAGD